MVKDKLKYLDSFDKFYQMLVDQVKKEKINERDFYMIIGAKVKSMNQERRERVNIKVDLTE